MKGTKQGLSDQGFKGLRRLPVASMGQWSMLTTNSGQNLVYVRKAKEKCWRRLGWSQVVGLYLARPYKKKIVFGPNMLQRTKSPYGWTVLKCVCEWQQKSARRYRGGQHATSEWDGGHSDVAEVVSRAFHVIWWIHCLAQLARRWRAIGLLVSRKDDGTMHIFPGDFILFVCGRFV